MARRCRCCFAVLTPYTVGMRSTDLAALYFRDLTRVVQELQAFPDTAAWWATAPGVTNAAGTLALHLEGNLREYIGRQLGRIPFTRDRPREFSDRGIAVAVNQEVVPRREWASTPLRPGDRIEIITAVQGG